MILPLGDVLLNTMQNLVSRIAGLNNEEISNRGIGMVAGMAYTIHSVGSQFISNRRETRFNSAMNMNSSNLENDITNDNLNVLANRTINSREDKTY